MFKLLFARTFFQHGCAKIDCARARTTKRDPKTTTIYPIMAPSTPKKRAKRREYNTPKRVQFFYAFDHKENSEGVGTVAHLPEINIPTSTARLWLKQREKLGSEALKSQRRSSSILGRPPKVSESDLCHITDQNDPIHEKGWETQAKSLLKQPAPRTLQRYANQAGAKRFKKPYQTKISKKNQSLRSIYGQKHENKTITRFWSQIWFTDEAHFQSIKLSQAPEYELRFPGQKRAINEVSSAGLDVTIHVAAGISYNHKGALIFYRDPAEPSEKPQKPRKPKQLKYEIDSVFQARVKVYEDLQAKEAITPKGNCMTQAFYAEKILPKHIEEIKTLEARHKI